MKYILALLVLIAIPVKAETINIPAQCGPTQDYLDVIQGEYNEQPVFISKGQAQAGGGKLYQMLMVNKETLTWTFMVINEKNGTTCAFASGKGFQFYEPGESI